MERLTKPGHEYYSCDFMDDGVYIGMNRLREYEDTGLTPEQIIEMDKMYTELAKEVMQLRKKFNNDRWIPVEKRLPDVTEGTEDPDCPEFNVMIKGASRSTTLKYSWDGTWFDDNGYLYDVIAWQPLPEPYRPERSEGE
mgnify:CR=1 FL=1